MIEFKDKEKRMHSFVAVLIGILLIPGTGISQILQKVFPGADERTPSRSEYFSWINNTNEGATEAQTMINLDFFQWLHEEYGMVLDIYAFDAGAIDGKRFYGRVDSDRFRSQFPNGFDPIYSKAKAIGTRLGVWGGPDGFGETAEEEAARIEQMAGLCRDYGFALFKFDAVCGPLRPEKEDAFIRMMTLCRRYSPDLILLNHRLGLERAQAHATTFLWEGKETYIDVFSTNTRTAPHHRADALSRGLVPDLQRLTEDHGVCISSCPDYWEDDLILQAFNRCLILAPQIYGNPWLLRDDEFPKLARIFNLHRNYRDILVDGMVLPEERYGPSAVARGNGNTRLITLRNLTWEPVTYTMLLDKEIGITDQGTIHCRQFHPVERVLGDYEKGQTLDIRVDPFRSCLLLVTAGSCDEPAVEGCDFEVVRDIPGKPVLIRLLGEPGTRPEIRLAGPDRYQSASLEGKPVNGLVEGRSVTVRFKGKRLQSNTRRRIGDLLPSEIPEDARTLYEATVFAADNNSLEVRARIRSGPTQIPQVQNARDAFFRQDVFIERGIWDRNLFDGDLSTGFWPSRKYGIDQRVKGGCLRLDLGEVTDADQIILFVPDEYSLQPLLNDEGNFVDISTDLRNWKQRTFLAGKRMVIRPEEPVRYLRFRSCPDRIVEIEGYKDGALLPRDQWRASNLFAHPSLMQPVKAWKGEFVLKEAARNSTLCIALEGEHGTEGAYAALRINGRPRGCPDRAPSYPSNTWEYVNGRRSRNDTYYVPVTRDMLGVKTEVFVLAYEKEKTDIRPVVWISACPASLESAMLELNRK
jgi:hypothetical protein